MKSNQFDLLGDVDNDDPSQLLAAAAAAAAKKAAEPKPAAPAAAKPPAKTPPTAEDARGNRGDGAGRGRGGFGRTGPRRDHGDADANGFEGGYGGGGSYAAPRLEDGEGKQAERGRGPRQPYRGGGGRRGGYSDGQNTDEFGRPHRSYERRSGTGRGFGMKRDGAGRGKWGTATDEGFPQEHVEAVSTEETPAVAEDEKKPEAEKVKEGAENAEEEKEAEEDKVTMFVDGTATMEGGANLPATGRRHGDGAPSPSRPSGLTSPLRGFISPPLGVSAAVAAC